jgi:hypothetical protein
MRPRLGMMPVISGPRISLCTAVTENQPESVWRGSDDPLNTLTGCSLCSFHPRPPEELISDKGSGCGFCFCFCGRRSLCVCSNELSMVYKNGDLVEFSLK